MKNSILILMTASSLVGGGCATTNETNQSLKIGSYLAYRISVQCPHWMDNHGPLDLGEAVCRITKDIENGDKTSIAIAKECK